MKHNYVPLLVSVCMLVHIEAIPQSGEVYASKTRVHSDKTTYTESRFSLKQSLNDIEKSFGVSIAYKDEWVENKNVSRKFPVSATVEEALTDVLKGTNLYFEKAGDRYYVIYQQSNRRGSKQSAVYPATLPPLYTSSSMQVSSVVPASVQLSRTQEVMVFGVSGVVRDENGESFPGVNVLVKGTVTGTSTDIEGRYSIDVPSENSVLVFSFVGYAAQEVAINGRSVVDVDMVPDVKSLDEIVVTALGIEKSTKGLGYATSKVNAEELSINRTSNIMNALQGKVAGVNISGLGPVPRETSKIRIRGQSSINGQDNPLVVSIGERIDNTNVGSNPGNR